MPISDRLDEIETAAQACMEDRPTDPNAVELAMRVPRLVAARRAVLTINTGDNRSVYGLDFEAGMCKALAIVHQTIAAALGEES